MYPSLLNVFWRLSSFSKQLYTYSKFYSRCSVKGFLLYYVWGKPVLWDSSFVRWNHEVKIDFKQHKLIHLPHMQNSEVEGHFYSEIYKW